MNHIYRVIWNRQKQVWQAVSELGKGQAKTTSETRIRRRTHTAAQTLAASVLSSVVITPAFAADLPTGGQVVAGSGQISQSGTTMTVTQNSDNLVTNWNSFNVGAGHTVNFVQPSASATALNRVIGSDVSVIQGAINANGRVFLVNPNGVLFTSTARINVGGMVASTLNIATEDFMSGNYRFEGAGSNAIINQGNITAVGDGQGGGSIALIAAKVTNTGTLVADRGQVLIGAGNKVELDLGGPVKLQVEQAALDALIDQGGAIKADGGLVYLTAKAAGELASTVINHSGITQARTLQTGEKGQIYLLGDMGNDRINVGGTLDASAPLAGDGGFIETSAANVVSLADGVVTTKAANGRSGDYLIDPTDYVIAASGGNITGAQVSQQLANNGTVTIQTLDGNLLVNDNISWSTDSNLILDAWRNIDLSATITAGHSEGKLTLKYGQNGLAGGNTAAYTLKPGGKVNLQAGENFYTQLGENGTLDRWQVITSLGAEDSVTATDLQGMNSCLSCRYVLGADIDAAATQSWNGGQGFEPIGLGGEFTGQLDGLGHKISSLSIDRSAQTYVGLFSKLGLPAVVQNLTLSSFSIKSDSNYVGGLAGYSDFGSISNVHVTDIDLQGLGYVGGLIGDTPIRSVSGRPNGRISNSHVSGSITGTGSNIGGLVGRLSFTNVSNAYTTAAVSGIDRVGGAFGFAGRSTLQNVYASGSVSSSHFWVGGLVGYVDSLQLSSNYWDVNGTGKTVGYQGSIVGSSTPIAVYSTTSTSAFAQSTYTSFDFDDTWQIVEGVSRPTLRSEVVARNDTGGGGTGTGGSGGSQSSPPSSNNNNPSDNVPRRNAVSSAVALGAMTQGTNPAGGLNPGDQSPGAGSAPGLFIASGVVPGASNLPGSTTPGEGLMQSGGLLFVPLGATGDVTTGLTPVYVLNSGINFSGTEQPN
ncbi:filamentous hemagglutinin N-terminal domain-containing protein [Pusillimonas minor]|uniref:Filamentous hemagglutinin N-terminal domain-containing protein n=1 Tax=Pusillimonas minor TaxID=2697024 RepID=A0A842HPS5_9BURK|nr:filamentous hemagglutinin N-terminal domain-containing protein [Pusillimonas minor]MBC2770216.1 filamentous hemagglutinin N-terminal domain-containing protein [Pusillimonas minor]